MLDLDIFHIAVAHILDLYDAPKVHTRKTSLSAIAVPRRREVLSVLSDGPPHAVNEIVLRTKTDQPAVARHLGALRKAGAVTVVKRGQHRMYSLDAQRPKPVHDWVKVFEHYWKRQVDKIKGRTERKVLERLIRLDDARNQKKEDQ